MHDELLRKGGKTPFQPANSDPVKPGRRHQHREEPGEEMIAGNRARVEQGHAMLRERCGADQAQPGIELASTDNDVDKNDDAGGIQWNRDI